MLSDVVTFLQSSIKIQSAVVFTFINSFGQTVNHCVHRLLIDLLFSTVGESLRYLFRSNNWKKFVMIQDASDPWNQYKEAVDSAIAMTPIQMVKSYKVNKTISDRELQLVLNEAKKKAWGRLLVMNCIYLYMKSNQLCHEHKRQKYGLNVNDTNIYSGV